MLLDDAHASLGWPHPEQVFNPDGSGASVYATFAKQKIGEALRRRFPDLQVETGVLAADPNSDSTEAPIAVVCQFPSGAREDVLDEAHRLAWNFSRTALLITLEPHRLIAWSCCQSPNEPLAQRLVCELPTSQGASLTGTAEQRSVRDLLHWVSLITGNLLKEQQIKFPANGRADALLLKNLKYIRRELLDDGIHEKYCHDLLARVIFTQFLFHRKDSDGRPFFDKPLLEGKCEGKLRRVHDGLPSILADKGETYALFRWLDEKFNGDLFPGKENQTDAERKQAWKEEENAVTSKRLRLLADLVSGNIDSEDKQLALWPQYSFDTIPLEFISSVYEEFLNEEKFRDKAYYTPAHLVDFVLDAVLPWGSDEWDLKILDGSCGSGIFLVKAFQRLIHRWRRKNKGKDPLVSDLKPILARNFIGVDKNEEAVRVACFSLYLAMADAIEPKYYLKREKVFPPLRGTRLIARDFFDESTPGYRTQEDAGSFDLVIGNAPWGDRSIKDSSDVHVSIVSVGDKLKKSLKKPKAAATKAEVWAQQNGWPVANHDIGPLFLAKSASLVNETGKVAMIQPAPLLYQRAEPARDFRRKFFLSYTVDEVTNLSAIRRELFANAIGPACVVVFGRQKPAPEQTLLYMCPKPLRDKQAGHRFVIEPQDVNQITHDEAANEAIVWSALAIGARRDLALALRLSQLSTLNKLESDGSVISRLGVIPGDKMKILDGRLVKSRRGNSVVETKLPDLRGKPYFEAKRFPPDVFLELNADDILAWNDPRVDDKGSTDFAAFKNPQLLIKLSFSVQEGRLRAAIVRSSDKEWGVICKKTYVTVHDVSTDRHNIVAACFAYNSQLATYFAGLTSSRMGHYITELLADELLDVPLPPTSVKALKEFDSFAAIDEEAKRVYKLTKADWILIEDFLTTTLRDALRKTPGPGHELTARTGPKASVEPELVSYAHHFTRVVNSTFGKAKNVCATVFEEPVGSRRLPVRMVAIHLDWQGHEPLRIEEMEAEGLMETLGKLYATSMERKVRAHSGAGLGFQRVAFIFHTRKVETGRVRSLYIIKPDQRRYWTRSLAMRDADQLSVAILRAVGRKTLNK
ncbi:MAG TPA: N-6 DNA methylase [Verrucomicrobiae bacterium]|jgi:type I restriction-modification system DNA methylase subunit|nr:N-6 DNA methylase [Verrucomicrobiae bacterium]